MSDDEENEAETTEATIIVDLEALRAKAEQKGELGELSAIDLEFTVGPEGEDNASVELDPIQPSCPVICFEFGNIVFAQMKVVFPAGYDFKIISELSELNTLLAGDGHKILMLNYDGCPEAVNRISSQAKTKFPECRIVIIAQKLDEEGMKKHEVTSSGAHAYLSSPFSAQQIKNQLDLL